MKRLQLTPVFQMAVALMAAILFFYSCKKDPETPKGDNKILIGITTSDTVSYLFAKVSTLLNGTGGNEITQHGHCWSVEANPDIGDAHTSLGSIAGPGKFTSDLSGLSDNIKYFIRPYFTIQAGTIYGLQKEINTLKKGKPVAITGVTNDITISSVKINGSAIFDSGSAITQKGICWDTAADPTLLKFIGHSEEGAGIGSFLSSISNLTENKQYYFCAYATNESGTSYGETKQFITVAVTKPTVSTFDVTDIALNSASCGGFVSNDGGGTVSVRGVCWNTTGNPTLTNCINKTQDGAGVGNYTSVINGLQQGTTYYVAGYASNEKGTSYGDIKQFITLQIIKPTVLTSNTTNITTTTATSGGNVTNAGNGTVSVRGVCWNTTGDPTLTNCINKTQDGTGVGNYISLMNGLQQGTTYYVAGYASNEKGTSYGDIKQFITVQIIKPTVLTSNTTNITATTATSGGNVTNAGNGTITARGVCWSTNPNPTLLSSHTTDGAGTGVFVSSLTNLTPNTNYYIRAYATNEAGTTYDNQINFSTLSLFYVGQNYGGGIIFYVDGTGHHGLVAATSNQSSGAPWGCYGTSIPGTSTAIGTGQTNTTLIVNGCSTAGIAARICNDLVLNGYSDWFLPSIDELNKLYLQKTVVGGFATNYYWSSSEYDAGGAWLQDFYDGTQYFYGKGATSYVRAVRAF